jgi:hypothetical protein
MFIKRILTYFFDMLDTPAEQPSLKWSERHPEHVHDDSHKKLLNLANPIMVMNIGGLIFCVFYAFLRRYQT